MTQPEPTRLLHAPDVDDEFKTALRKAVDPGPGPEQLRRVAERLGVAPAAEEPAAPDGQPERALGRGGKGLLTRIGLLSVPIVASLLWWNAAGTPRRAPTTPRTESRAVEAHDLEATRPAPTRSDGASTVTPAAPSSQHVRPPRVRRHRAAAPAPSNPLAELALLRRARAVLRSDPESALRLTEQHLTEHARGLLGEERELLAIEALMNLERAEEARARANAFERNFPASAHTRRLHVILSGVSP